MFLLTFLLLFNIYYPVAKETDSISFSEATQSDKQAVLNKLIMEANKFPLRGGDPKKNMTHLIQLFHNIRRLEQTGAYQPTDFKALQDLANTYKATQVLGDKQYLLLVRRFLFWHILGDIFWKTKLHQRHQGTHRYHKNRLQHEVVVKMLKIEAEIEHDQKAQTLLRQILPTDQIQHCFHFGGATLRLQLEINSIDQQVPLPNHPPTPLEEDKANYKALYQLIATPKQPIEAYPVGSDGRIKHTEQISAAVYGQINQIHDFLNAHFITLLYEKVDSQDWNALEFAYVAAYKNNAFRQLSTKDQEAIDALYRFLWTLYVKPLLNLLKNKQLPHHAQGLSLSGSDELVRIQKQFYQMAQHPVALDIFKKGLPNSYVSVSSKSCVFKNRYTITFS